MFYKLFNFTVKWKKNLYVFFKKQNIQGGLNTWALPLLLLILCLFSFLASKSKKSSSSNILPRWFHLLPSLWMLLKDSLAKKMFFLSLPLILSTYLYSRMRQVNLFPHKAYIFAFHWWWTSLSLSWAWSSAKTRHGSRCRHVRKNKMFFDNCKAKKKKSCYALNQQHD